MIHKQILRVAMGTLITLSVVLLASCRQQKPQEQAKRQTMPDTPRFVVTKLDMGPLTQYDFGSKGRTKIVPDTPLRRSVVVLNDSSCPLRINSFGVQTRVPDRVMADAVGSRLEYLVDWSLTPLAPITSWEVHNFVFDTMNRFLWAETSNNEARTGDSNSLRVGTTHNTSRLNWWKSQETDALGKWVTSVVFVGRIRTDDGRIWACDSPALIAEMKKLSFDPAGSSLSDAASRR